MPTCLIGIGSNLGNRAGNIAAALKRLAGHPQIAIRAQSTLFETAPVGGPPDQGDFLNGAALLETTLDPKELLAELLRVEVELGRVRDVHWGPRAIDLDLLLYGNEIIDVPNLKVPHALMHLRSFVLAPAAEIAPKMVHPGFRRTLAELLEHLNSGDANPVY